MKTKTSIRIPLAALTASALLFATAKSSAQTSNYTFAGTGDWSVTGNWDNGVPNGVGHIARFNQSGSDRTTTLDTSVTLGSLRIDDRKAWNISGTTNTITFDTVSGNATVFAGGAATNSNINTIKLNIAPAVILNLGSDSLFVNNIVRPTDRNTRINFANSITGTGNLLIQNNNAVGDLVDAASQTYAGEVNMIGAISTNASSSGWVRFSNTSTLR